MNGKRTIESPHAPTTPTNGSSTPRNVSDIHAFRGRSAQVLKARTVSQALRTTLEALMQLDGVSAAGLMEIGGDASDPQAFVQLGDCGCALALCQHAPCETAETQGFWTGPVTCCHPVFAHLLSIEGFVEVLWLRSAYHRRRSLTLFVLSREASWRSDLVYSILALAATLGGSLARLIAESELLARSEELEHLAFHDPLTRLPNRHLLSSRLSRACARAKRSGTSLAVCYLDLDGFKTVNDRLGHAMGDQVLNRTAECLLEASREDDTVARLGGDEFVLLMSGLQDTQDLPSFAHRVLDGLQAGLADLDLPTPVTASMGITLFPQDDADGDTLLRHADHAMYDAKNRGRNTYALFDAGRLDQTRILPETVDEIRRAIVNDEFILYFQPQVDLRTGRVSGLEALIRWQHPHRGLLEPNDFLQPVITGHYAKTFDEWVIQSALRQMERWQIQGLDLIVSVNISGSQLQDSGFAERLGRFLKRHPSVPPNRLHLEILESAALANIATASHVIQQCERLGVHFALDDFGTGYSSLTYLKELPATSLKIDRSFVAGMLADAGDLAIVEGIVGLSQAFQRNVIAEGVESDLHGELLLKAGCQNAQGFAISRPLPPHEVAPWVRAYRAPETWRRAASRFIRSDKVSFLTLELALRSWVRHLFEAIETGGDFHDLGESNCFLGRWIRGEGVSRYGRHPEIRNFIRVHRRLHQIAEQMHALSAPPEDEEMGYLRQEILLAQGALIDILQRIFVDEQELPE
ncbi:diguanylate cyclase/phosphodiesterase [Thiorhodococcus drewsii AZ1]|uniref:Diguanylate cyclase/phosphodiesterase n=1 Tax=Thiorhodococcus drewsii AZ1 TaxID=765913 RepID=G2E6R4_9GAMM|nr:EAL domain-containing protein [Thiorhodococcus drewsii]EGV28211.1 diguanylate cyclase/phosphodiesterase [Thiorhodococcus drewsii AZ1]